MFALIDPFCEEGFDFLKSFAEIKALLLIVCI